MPLRKAAATSLASFRSERMTTGTCGFEPLRTLIFLATSGVLKDRAPNETISITTPSRTSLS